MPYFFVGDVEVVVFLTLYEVGNLTCTVQIHKTSVKREYWELDLDAKCMKVNVCEHQI